jgi:HAE1 family hydrophobic/amphiphilic exporter-1
MFKLDSWTRHLAPRRRPAAGLMALLLAAPAAWGQEAAAPAAPAPGRLEVTTDVAATPQPPELVRGERGILLTLDDAVAIALRQNLTIAVQRLEHSRSRFGVVQNLGIYDVRAAGEVREFDETTATGSQLESSSREQQVLNFSLTQLLPTGTDLSLFWNNSRFASDSVFQTLNPQFDSDLGLSLTQPLLRDFGRVPTERFLRLARVDNRISGQEFERQVAQAVRDVETAYWNLVEAREQLVVAEESLGLARELHERNRIQVEVGTMAPLEMVQSESAIAVREEDIIRAQAAVADAADQLRLLLNLPPGDLWELAIEPQTQPAIPPVSIDVDQGIETALANRWELAQQQLVIQREEIDEAFLRNQTLPSLDFTLRYNYSGTGGDLLVERDPVTGRPIRVVPGGFGDAFDQLTERNFDTLLATLTLGFPLQNRAARAQRASAQLAIQRENAELADLRARIATEVRTAARALDTAAKQIEAARSSRGFQERNLDAERKRYENGMSTSFRINEIQEDLTQARSREVTAVTTYRRALADYYLVTGRLLEEKGIEVAEQEEVPEERFGF